MINRIDTTAEAMIATCSAELATNRDPVSFCRAELKMPMSATSAPGQRPAIVVTRMIAGGKKMNDVRPWVIGKTTQCSAAAAMDTTSAKAYRRATDFSIHGQSRASRDSLEMREA